MKTARIRFADMPVTALVVALIFGLVSPGTEATEALPFLTGFESTETPSYSVGDLDGQGTAGSWSVLQGTVHVQTGLVVRGAQGVELGSESAAEVAVSASNNVIWTDLYFRTGGATNAPAIPADPATSVLFFSATNGLLALDGDGAGGGTFTTVVASLPGGQFARVSVRQDYSAQTYDVWVDDTEEATGLGFLDNSLTSVSSVRVDAEGQSYLDDLSVTVEGIDNDADSDRLADLDELKLYGTLPHDDDTDDDRMKDGDEVFVGTSPTDGNDVYAISITTGSPQIDVLFDTIPDRLYDVQLLADLPAGGWSNDPANENIPGDGTQKQRTIDSSGPGQNVRVVVKPQP